MWEQRYGGYLTEDGGFDYNKLRARRSILHDMYAAGKIKKLNEHEMSLLRFCHGIDVKKFIKEEFEKNPIILKTDENGYLYAELPKRKEKDDTSVITD